MIITFCGYGDYQATVEDEQKILSILLFEKIGDQNAELFLGGYGAFDAFAKNAAVRTVYGRTSHGHPT